MTYRDLVVYVEMDRCASDAVAVVTGVTLGRRRLKWVDYGKMAATFVDLYRAAYRIAPRPEVPHAGPDEDPLEVWKDWTEEQLFTCAPVRVAIPLEDRPGRPLTTARCSVCREKIQDRREVELGGRFSAGLAPNDRTTRSARRLVNVSLSGSRSGLDGQGSVFNRRLTPVAWLRLLTAGGDRDDAARYVELLVPAPSLTRGLMGPSPDTPASRQDALLT